MILDLMLCKLLMGQWREHFGSSDYNSVSYLCMKKRGLVHKLKSSIGVRIILMELDRNLQKFIGRGCEQLNGHLASRKLL